MRALLIGGTQFMGREVVRRLVERGHDVSVLHRSVQHDLGPDVQNLQADRADLTTVAALIGDEPFEAVFDFAYDNGRSFACMPRAVFPRRRSVRRSSMALASRSTGSSSSGTEIGNTERLS